MHQVERIRQALEVARSLGYDIRHDWLGGEGGGHCLLHGRKMLLLDLAQSADEQFALIRDALRGEMHLDRVEMSNELAMHLDVRSVA